MGVSELREDEGSAQARDRYLHTCGELEVAALNPRARLNNAANTRTGANLTMRCKSGTIAASKR